MSKVMILDIETNNNPYFGAVASPRHPDNYVVELGYAIEETPYSGEVHGVRYESKEAAHSWLNIPDDVTLLVCHNAPYELDWFLHQQRPAILAFLKRGGRIFCTAYAHYLLSQQQDQYPALDVIAPMYGGTHKVDGIKILWQQGVLTADIDPALLHEYLCGPEGDIVNTRLVFWGQVQQLQERGMWDMALERMEGMLFCSFAMDAGMYVNQEVAADSLARHNAELELLHAAFNSHRANFPEECVFKESSAFHMSAWLFGGPVKYRARIPATNADGTFKYVKITCYKFGTTLVQIPAEGITADQFEACVQTYGDCDRFSRGKNAGKPKEHKVDGTEIQTKWGELIYDAPGIVPIGVLPKDILDDFQENFTGKRFLSDGSPVISTGADCLKMLVARTEFPADVREILNGLLKFAMLDKDVGTYYLREELDDDGNVVKTSGMLQYLTPQSFVHHNLNLTATVTTRLSGSRPNFQNLPRGDENEYHTSEVKMMFTSRFGDDGVIVEADYTAVEVVTLAAFSQDQALIDALVAGTDMHCLRLSKKLGESYESVLEKCKTKDHPEFHKYDQMRTDIKAPSFAYQYGATARGIAFATGYPLADAEKFIADEKALFPGVEAFFTDKVFPTVNANITQHREQFDDGQFRLYGRGVWKSWAGTEYAFRQYPKNVWVDGQKLQIMEFKPTQMRNYPIQGESGFFIQGITGLIIRWLIANDFFGGKVHVINTVHDSIYLDCHKDVLGVVCAGVKSIMESLPTYYSEKYGYPLNVPYPVGIDYGPSMGGNKVKYKPEDFQ